MGLLTGAIAWYASFAGVTNSTFKRTVLPVFPLELSQNGARGDGRAVPGQARTEAGPQVR